MIKSACTTHLIVLMALSGAPPRLIESVRPVQGIPQPLRLTRMSASSARAMRHSRSRPCFVDRRPSRARQSSRRGTEMKPEMSRRGGADRRRPGPHYYRLLAVAPDSGADHSWGTAWTPVQSLQLLNTSLSAKAGSICAENGQVPRTGHNVRLGGCT